MKTKITNITSLYFVEMILENLHPKHSTIVWYRPNEIYNIEEFGITNIDDSIIFKDFDRMGFPEYKYIACAVIDDYIENKDIENFMEFQVMVDDKSKFSKNHMCDDKGFIRLFTIAFQFNKRIISQHKKHKYQNFSKMFEIKAISINGKLVSEKINLSAGDKYPNTLNNFDNETVENDSECAICLETKGQMIETSCKHKFHLSCLKCAPNLVCPLCRADIKDCLTLHGVSDEEITYRLTRTDNETKYENLCVAIDFIATNNLSESDFLRLCLESLKLNDGNIVPYCDLIFDMNANAAHLFAKISSIKSRNEKGAFMYMYDSAVQFCMQMRDPKSKSIVQWTELSDYQDTPFYNIIENRVNRITDPENEYVVVIMIENMINAHIINIRTHPAQFKIRIHQRDILNSVIKCIRCRCSGDCNGSPNREYIWARAKLQKLHKQDVKRSHKQIFSN